MNTTTLNTLLRRGWPALLLLALTLIFFHRLAFSGLILGRGDTYAYFYPYWTVRNAALIQGQLPLWSPDIFMGVPLLANPQLGTFYPPNWPLIPLSPPDGIRLSVLAHGYWALLGAYLLARRWLRGPVPALAAAAVFGLGGHVGAHVEQVNQLQGLAWLPWLFLLYDRALIHPRRCVPMLALALALQFLAGHTQTVFISGAGLAMFGLLIAPQRGMARSALTLIAAGLLAVPLILPQLIPTLELTGISNRSGGLNPSEATAFSLHPLIIGRGLLPSYDGIVFGEYVGYGGVIGLGLAIVGLAVPRRSDLSGGRVIWGALALLGFLLALGEFNPLYWQLARLPGFSSFRVPARWLALFALGTGLLAGTGLQFLIESRRLRWLHLAAVVVMICGLALSSLLAGAAPEDVVGPAVPTAVTWAGWGLALVALIVSVGPSPLSRSARIPFSIHRPVLLLPALLFELFFAAAVLPYNTLVLPETYQAQRFTISQLLAYNETQTPPGRLLSISELLFDPGDRAALEVRYQQYGLSDLAVRISHVATKLKEIVAPNLPLTWGIPSIDGFDGGLLPTRHYTAFTRLMLPPDALPTIDGRLRELLAREECRGACIPDQRWLDLTNTRYLITDKVFDPWHEGIAYDTAFAVTLDAVDIIRLTNPTAFEADAVDLLYRGDGSLEVALEYTASRSTAGLSPLSGTQFPSTIESVENFQHRRWQADSATAPEAIIIQAAEPVTVQAVTLVDTRTGDFAQLVPDSNWQRVLSSDIKLYENGTVLPRAFVVHDILAVPDTDEGTASALAILRDPSFDPARTAVIHTHQPAETYASATEAGTATTTRYAPEQIIIDVQTEAAGYLVLTDTFYPGWRAAVNHVETPIERADVMFRAVPVPAGASQVTFEYRPAWHPSALAVGLVSWIILFPVMFVLWRRH
jgi:hypothetical protein